MLLFRGHGQWIYNVQGTIVPVVNLFHSIPLYFILSSEAFTIYSKGWMERGENVLCWQKRSPGVFFVTRTRGQRALPGSRKAR